MTKLIILFLFGISFSFVLDAADQSNHKRGLCEDDDNSTHYKGRFTETEEASLFVCASCQGDIDLEEPVALSCGHNFCFTCFDAGNLCLACNSATPTTDATFFALHSAVGAGSSAAPIQPLALKSLPSLCFPSLRGFLSPKDSNNLAATCRATSYPESFDRRYCVQELDADATASLEKIAPTIGFAKVILAIGSIQDEVFLRRVLIAFRNNLQWLTLSYCKRAAEAFAKLEAGSLPTLTEINLGWSDATPDQLQALLRACSNLQALDLWGYRGAAEAFIGFAPGSLPNLTIINLDYTDATPVQVQALLRACPNLQELNLWNCKGAAEAFVELEPGSLPNLTIINLDSTKAKPDQVQALMRACPNLQDLYLEGCTGSAQAFVGFAPESLPNVTKITLTDSSATSEQVQALLKAFPNLQELNLEGCTGAAKAFAAFTPGSLPNLIKIDLGYTDLKSEQVLVLLRACPNLQELYLWDCSRGAAKAFAKLEPGSLPNLTIIFFRCSTATPAQTAQMSLVAPNAQIINDNNIAV